MAKQVLLLLCAITILNSFSSGNRTCPHPDFVGKHLADKGSLSYKQAATAKAALAHIYRNTNHLGIVTTNTVYVKDRPMTYYRALEANPVTCTFEQAVLKFQCTTNDVTVAVPEWNCKQQRGWFTAAHEMQNGHFISDALQQAE